MVPFSASAQQSIPENTAAMGSLCLHVLRGQAGLFAPAPTALHVSCREYLPANVSCPVLMGHLQGFVLQQAPARIALLLEA